MKNQYYEDVCRFIDDHRDEIIEKWKQFVNLEGHYDEKENVEKAQAWFRHELEETGFRTWTVESRPDRCSVLLGILGEDRPGKPILFGGHLDTVHPKGSFGKENPFHIEDGKAFGPGVLDMKGGLVMALYITKALQSLNFDRNPIKFVVAGEEEGDHVGTDVDLLYTEESKGALCAFNMETGHITNSLCVGRKTQYTFFATVHGKGGHAGNEFTKGHNALTEAVLKINEMLKSIDLDKGTTVTPSVMHCGKNTTSIPDLCEFAVDVRIMNQAEGQRVKDAFDEIMNHSYVPGTTTEYTLEFAKLLEFEPNEKILGLYEFVNKTAVDNGFEPFGKIILGGASDTGAIARADIPVLCSCGVVGEFNHNIREYAVVESMFNRAKIYTLAILDMK
ncbi:MAG: M20/M25/M40 family metallo-hydrolase [Clostridiales bacterium]|nr:M20/M25/M40 family metallo-hydrolase [Clostridiales bacterium]